MPTQAEFAKHLDLAARSARELRDQGIINLDGSLDDARVAYIRHLRRLKGGQGTASLADARARKEGISAEIAEIELAKMRGELVERSAVSDAFEEVMTHFRKGLRALAKAAVTALGLSGEKARKLQTMIDRCLNELSRFNFGEPAPGPRGAKARARRTSKRPPARRTA